MFGVLEVIKQAVIELRGIHSSIGYTRELLIDIRDQSQYLNSEINEIKASIDVTIVQTLLEIKDK